MFQNLDARYKLALIGDGGVGKTTLINRYITGSFIKDYSITIGVEFYTKTLQFENKKVSLKIWDFAGQDQYQFKNLLPNYISGASGVIFQFDITRIPTIKNISTWLALLKLGLEDRTDKIPILLVGGKSDLEQKRSVQSDYIDEIVKTYDLYDYIECSSLTGFNVESIFLSITKKMLESSKLL